MSKITRSARMEDCTFRIPGVCNRDPETTVWCHAPHPKKGMGIKGPDSWGAYGCSNCHAVMDGKAPYPVHYFEGRPITKKERWHDAICESQDILTEKGHLLGMEFATEQHRYSQMERADLIREIEELRVLAGVAE